MTHSGPQLAQRNVVVTANQFNPSIFSQRWIEKIGAVTESEFQVEQICTPVMALVSSSLFTLNVVGERLQMTFPPDADPIEGIERLRLIVRALPETPYKAVGLNVAFGILKDDVSPEHLTRTLFASDNTVLSRPSLPAEGVYFGGYVSFPFGNGRIRVDAKPAYVKFAEQDPPRMGIVMSLNLHADVSGDKLSEQVISALDQWDVTMEQAQDFAMSISEQEVS